MEANLIKGTLVTALFDDQASAQTAIDELRRNGVGNEALSIVSRDHAAETDGLATGEPGDPDTADNAHVARGAIGGGALGAGLAVAALAIPGVGPFIAAGAIAAAAVPAAMTAGVAVGAGLGGLREVLHDRGVHDEDATYYADRMSDHSVMVGVDPSATSISAQRIDEILMSSGGHRSTSAAAMGDDAGSATTMAGTPTTTASTGTPSFATPATGTMASADRDLVDTDSTAGRGDRTIV